MYQFWEQVIHPMFLHLGLRRIVEIGAATGINSQRIVNYCQLYQGELTIIDPAPQFDIPTWNNMYSSYLTIFKQLSLHALPQLSDYDAVLIDGDHNWYTVYHELKIVESVAIKQGKLPIVILHDTEWPYGRRDMYYLPETIPVAYRKEYAQRGLIHGYAGLAIDQINGMNSHLYNALLEGGERNGVLTAIEDFLNETSLPYVLHRLYSNFGLAVIIPNEPSINYVVSQIIALSRM